MRCKFCGKKISEKTSVIFYMGKRTKKNEDMSFITICYDCSDEIRNVIDEIADNNVEV